MVKRISRSLAIAIALALFMTTIMYAFAVPVHAASKPDLKKANISWDLKNNKSVKFKTKWYALGVKTHTVKMTNYKVQKAKKEGYKQVSFKLTFNRKINKPSSKQIIKMAKHYGKYGSFGGEFWYGILDYQTGQSLDFNDKDISISTSDWKYSKTKKYVAKDKSWISYARKATVTIKIVYPESYKDLVVCVGGATTANGLNLYSFWDGNGKFSNQKKLYSKKDKKYAHAMRIR